MRAIRLGNTLSPTNHVTKIDGIQSLPPARSRHDRLAPIKGPACKMMATNRHSTGKHENELSIGRSNRSPFSSNQPLSPMKSIAVSSFVGSDCNLSQPDIGNNSMSPVKISGKLLSPLRVNTTHKFNFLNQSSMQKHIVSRNEYLSNAKQDDIKTGGSLQNRYHRRMQTTTKDTNESDRQDTIPTSSVIFQHKT